MTFDDGILTVWSRANVAENGEMPRYELTKQGEYFFGFDYLGFSRFYEAMKAQVELSHIVNVADWIDIDTADIIRLEDGKDYRCVQIQKQWEDGLKITKISLEVVRNEI